MLAASVTFAHGTTLKSERKKVREERRLERKERRMERRAEVSPVTKMQFGQDFPGAGNVHFIKTSNFDEVSFTTGNKKLRAYYDYTNTLVGTTEKVAFTDLSEMTQNQIRDKYAGDNVVSVIKYDDNEYNDMDMILYGTSFDDADNYFVELNHAGRKVVLRVDSLGYVSFFKDIK